jgi:hypothetical protein
MAYTLAFRGHDGPGKKAVAKAALSGIEVATAAHRAPKVRLERLAIQEGFKVFDGSSFQPLPIESYGSVGPNPDVYTPQELFPYLAAAVPTKKSVNHAQLHVRARFKGEDPRFQAQVAETLRRDAQDREIKVWHARQKAANQTSAALAKITELQIRGGRRGAANRPASGSQMDSQILRQSSEAFRSSGFNQSQVDKSNIDETARSLWLRQPSSSDADVFRLLSTE